MSPNPGFAERLNALEPAAVRGVVVAIVALIALVTGRVIGDNTVDTVVDVLLILLPIVTGFFIKGAVTANERVAVLVPDPVNKPLEVESGAADLTAVPDADILEAANGTPKAA